MSSVFHATPQAVGLIKAGRRGISKSFHFVKADVALTMSCAKPCRVKAILCIF